MKLLIRIINTIIIFTTFGFSQTYLSGVITTDSTLEASGNPYIVNGILNVLPGVTLTISPGVELNFDDGIGLFVSGTLNAIGTANDSIKFTSSSQTPIRGIWTGIDIENNQGGNAILQYCNILYASYGIDVDCCWQGGPVNIYDSKFSNNLKGLQGYAGWDVIIERCIFTNNTYAVTSGDKQISNSIFINNEYGIYHSSRVNVYNSVFTNHSQIAIYGTIGVIDGCTIYNNTVGIKDYYSEGFAFKNCTITENDTGFILNSYSTSSRDSANNIDNFVYNMINTDSYHVNARDNWWGTTSDSIIQAKIYDIYDDPTLGIIYYSPFLNLPNTSAPISPPKNFHVFPDTGGSCLLTWHANLEADLSGYKIYYNTSAGYPYSDSIDVGNITSYSFIPPSQGTIYYITVTAYDINADGVNDQFEGYESWYAKEKTTFPSSITEKGNEIPKLFILYQNYPNPFNPSTTILYSLNKGGFVNLKVYDIMGREILTLVNQFQKVNRYKVHFDGSNLSSGIYYYKLLAGNEFSETRKMILMK